MGTSDTAQATGRFLEDKESFQALVSLMPDSAKAKYQGYGSMSLLSGFPNRKLVVYTLQGGKPEGISMLTLGDMEMTPFGGPTIEVSDAKGNTTLTVNPQQWRGRDLFLQVPQNFIFKWKGKYTPSGEIQFVPHYAVLVKTRSKEHLQIDGDTYCATLNEFRERFPKVSARY